jgi:hypothetical protein
MYKRDDTTLRLRAGYNSFSSDFVFELYDADGSLAIGLNSTGQVIVSGNIQTPKDVYVGKRLIVNAETSNIPYVDEIEDEWYDFSFETGIFICNNGTTEIGFHIVNSSFDTPSYSSR